MSLLYVAKKSEIRKSYKSQRDIITAKYRIIADSILEEKLIAYLESFIIKNKCHSSLYIGVYFPIGSELNILEIMKNIIVKDKIRGCDDKIISIVLLLPRISEKEPRLLEFKIYNGKFAELINNKKYNILEPDKNIDSVIPDIIICPLLAFDDNKYRLGYGGGFYDYSLPLLRKNKQNNLNNICEDIGMIALAYSFMKVNGKLPLNSYDYPLDDIIY